MLLKCAYFVWLFSNRLKIIWHPKPRIGVINQTIIITILAPNRKYDLISIDTGRMWRITHFNCHYLLRIRLYVRCQCLALLRCICFYESHLLLLSYWVGITLVSDIIQFIIKLLTVNMCSSLRLSSTWAHFFMWTL